MKTFGGQILDGSGNVVAKVDVTIAETFDGDPLSWDGACLLPDDHNVSMTGNYRIKLSDGRSGEMVPVKIEHRSGRMLFQGSGPLE